MNVHKKRHRLLLLLNNQKNSAFDNRELSIGIEFLNVEKELENDKFQVWFITSELREQNEIDFFNVNGKRGFYITEKGTASLSNEKYLRIDKDLKWNKLKNFVSVVIPILSLLVTLYVVIYSGKRENELKSRIEVLEREFITNRK